MELRAPATEIAEAGLYELPAEAYHADPCRVPSLNSGTARLLCGATPRHAWAKHPRLTPYEDENDGGNDAMRMGSVVHELLLGKGGGFAVLDFDDFRTKAAKQARDEAIVAGLTPIKKADYERARLVADIAEQKLADSPECADALTDGRSEVAAIWREPTGPWCRCMFDRLKTDLSVVYDIKTTEAGITDRQLQNKVANDGLDLQAAFYLRGLWTICPEMSETTVWRWIFVETKPPYELRVIEADATTLAMGARKAAFAIDAWRRCMEANRWPGYARGVERLEYLPWAEAAWLERELVAADAGRDPLAGLHLAPVAERAGEILPAV